LAGPGPTRFQTPPSATLASATRLPSARTPVTALGPPDSVHGRPLWFVSRTSWYTVPAVGPLRPGRPVSCQARQAGYAAAGLGRGEG